MTGRLFVILGASGAGKDSLLRALAGHAASHSNIDLSIARRVITRQGNSQGEDFESVSPDAFERMEAEGAFLFSWHAHGLRYGIRRDILEEMEAGRHAVFNGSRKALGEMRAIRRDMVPILITVDPELLEARLRKRGREGDEEIAARIRRGGIAPPEGCHVIANDGPIEETALSCLELMSAAISDPSGIRSTR